MMEETTSDVAMGHRSSGTAKKWYWSHIFMAFYGMGWAVTADVGIRLYGAEVIVLLSLVILKWTPLLRRYPILTAVLGAYGLWVLAILISDLINATVLFDLLRNMFTPILGAAGVVFVTACVMRAPRSILTYFIAIGLAKAILGEPLYGEVFDHFETSWASVQQNSNFFKVRFEPALSPLAICVAILLSRRSPKYGGLWLVAISVFFVYFDARSAGAMILLAGLATILIHRNFQPKLSRVFMGAITALSLSYGAYVAYVSYVLNSDNPSLNAAQLLQVQNPYNPISLLLIGRSEWLVMPQAIAERPIVGWGSWARDEDGRFASLRSNRLRDTTLDLSDRTGELYIPAHSVVGAAWVWSGLLGFVAMTWLAKLIWRLIVALPQLRSALLPALCYLAAMLIWHFLFSPPQSVRIHFPIALGALIAMTRVPQSNKPGKSNLAIFPYVDNGSRCEPLTK